MNSQQDLPPSIKKTKTGAKLPTGLIVFLLIAGAFLYHEERSFRQENRQTVSPPKPDLPKSDLPRPKPTPDLPTTFQTDAKTLYLLSLSWSPQYCADEGSSRNDQQCEQGRRYDFVVHGLWPQTEKICAAPFIIEKPIERQFATLFPNLHLLRHEWQKHGRCHFESPESYFKTIEAKTQAVRIPPPLRQPLQQIEWTPEEILNAFRAANPSSHPASFALHCRGKFFREIRQCLDGQLKPRACEDRERGNCRRFGKLIIRPVR